MSLVEIIVLNDEDARIAEANGADRLELVSAMGEGGLTPSFGTIKTVVNAVNIPVMVMVRPHSYSFVYGKQEWMAIREDIRVIRELGAAGIVFGAITEKKAIDFDMLAMVLEEAKGLDVTFHRAIDQPNALTLYQMLCQSPFKVNSVLTSGGEPTAMEGIETLQRMIKESQHSSNYPVIMPGSGLSPANIETIHQELHASEYHFGSAVRIDGDFRNPIQGDKIRRIKDLVKE
ncbi:copper homeostasis protein CutC [Neobacillus massiliamazoniensis]|uniref:PF03932 family protein CutC n=1 Tax=Neobacillus massiliamazoniensis TaxID=1499688 RepID=A0A0U1NVI2_9BACI|nr:copper homeostasis protein CutC [Neobacillus massiliamazoniensis]CRK82026.1 CutC family protein [Neobacillus massiliamazoniensis]